MKGVRAGSVVVDTKITTKDATATTNAVAAAVMNPTANVRQQAGSVTVTGQSFATMTPT